MKKLTLLSIAVGLAGCNGASVVPTPSSQTAAQSAYVPQWKAQHLARAACPDVRPGEAQCAVLVGIGKVQPGVAGWAPADIASVYRLPSAKKGKHQVIGIVDAYDNPNVASDLAVYRSNFGLPPADFHKFNQKGQQKNYPKADQGWGIEITIDVDMVSAACPNCTIYLIEANNNSLRNLGASVERAVKLGARIVSNSWGCYQVGCKWHTNVFDDPAALYLAASGDIGYGTFPPAEFSSVISVGGTVLSKSGSTYSERVWPDTGGGCATGIAKPSWQNDPDCSWRTGNDIAAVSLNVAAYDTYGYSGWVTTYGTSIATPIVASAFALAGGPPSKPGGEIFWELSKKQVAKDLHAIKVGSVGKCPPSLNGSYLCTAGTGQFGTYSGPSGWGTLNGIGAL